MTRLAVFTLLASTACGDGLRSAQATAPWRTAFDSTGDTIVARTTGEVPNESERKLVLELQIGQAEGNDSVTFGRIEHLAVTSDGRLFVFDGQGPSLKLFDSTGTLVRFVGRKGGGPAEFEQVTGIGTLPGDRVALWDASHGRVNVYTASGDLSTQWRVPISGFFSSDGLQTDSTGAVVLRVPIGADKSKASFGVIGLVRFNAVGDARDTIQPPAWIDPPPTLRAQSDRVRSMRNLPFAPRQISTWSRSGALLSGPSTPYAIYLTHRAGRPLRIEQEWKPLRVLPDEGDHARADLTWAMRTVDPGWNWTGPGIPETKPAYERLQSGEDARIWVKIHTTAERIENPEERRSEAGQPPRPVQRYAEPNAYDVFDSNGAYLGRVRIDRRQQIMRMLGDRVWGVLTDSLGVAYVARWRVEPPFQRPE